jgi:hypothetical protein
MKVMLRWTRSQEEKEVINAMRDKISFIPSCLHGMCLKKESAQEKIEMREESHFAYLIFPQLEKEVSFEYKILKANNSVTLLLQQRITTGK